MSGLNVRRRCEGSADGRVIDRGTRRLPALTPERATGHRHRVPAGHRDTSLSPLFRPFPLFRCVTRNLVSTATEVAPGTARQHYPRERWLICQHRRRAPGTARQHYPRGRWLICRHRRRAPETHGITVSCAGPQGMMLAQDATSAPVRMHLVGQVPASRNSSGGSR